MSGSFSKVRLRKGRFPGMVGRRNGHKGWLHGTIKLVAVQVRKYIEIIGAKFLTA